jgi:protein-histidine N-methyltransferase
MQLMAEDSGTESAPLSGLDDSDIKTNVYEGGFKSWECSIDLVRFLLDRGPRKDLDDLCRVDHVIEVELPFLMPLNHTRPQLSSILTTSQLGCGTALPTLLLLHYALTARIPLYLTLADYNSTVLHLVTLPNLLLTYASTLPTDSFPFSPSSPNPFTNTAVTTGELDLTPALLSSFRATLESLPLTLTLVSGSWNPTPAFLALVPTAPEMNTFLLASETIYSPTALSAFAEVMIGLLGRVRAGKAVVAAKRVYFGVGGGVDEFRVECARLGAVAGEVEFEGLEGEGVRRSLVEVQML